MATNIEQIFRDFVMNKIKEIEDETQETSVADEPQSQLMTETREDGLKEEKMNTPTDKVTHTDPQDNHDKEDTSTKHRKSKKHKKHKSKKKKKKHKEGKDSSSDKETQESGKKKKRKKKKKSKDTDKVKQSGSRSESSSASVSESESELKPSSENTKSSSAAQSSQTKPQELPDIIPKMENSVHKHRDNEKPKEKKKSSSRRSKSKESSRGRRSRSRSPRRKSERRSRSPNRQRRSKSRKRSPQRSDRSRSRSRSHSVRRGKRSRSRRTRSRSVVILKRNRKSTSKSKSRSPQRRHRSRSKSQSRTKPSKSRSVSKSRTDLKPETESDPMDGNRMQTDVSQDATEDRKSPTVAVNSETASNISNAAGFKGSWRPVPFLAEPSETKSSQKCVTPEMPLAVTNVSEEPSTFSNAAPKDSQCAANTEKKETNSDPTLTSPSKSPSHETSSRSKAPHRRRHRKRRGNPGRLHESLGRPPKGNRTSLERGKRSKSRSPKKKKKSRSRSRSRRRKSRTPDRSRRSKSRKRSRSRSKRRSRSRSGSRWGRGFGSRALNQRDRWKREPSRSPVLILRKKRSASGTRRSTSKTPPRLTELDKEQLLEIAKANAAAMCAKAGVPIPESLRPRSILQMPLQTSNPSSLSLQLPVMSSMTMNAAMASMTAATMTAALSSMGALASLPQMAPLPTIVNKPPSSSTPNLASIEEAKKKVTKQANSFSIKELTERCKKIAESKEEMAIAKPHVSDDEEDERLIGASLKENKGIAFSLGSTSIKPGVRTEAVFAKEFPVSSGSQHRKKEADGAYGEWVPVEKKVEKPSASSSSGTEETSKNSDSVFPEAPSQPVDITLAVSERAVAQKRLAENPFDINAMCMLNRAQEQVDAWAQSNTIPGLFTGSTGAQVLSSDELSNSGTQAWIKKDQFLRAAPVSGGMGELLMRKMGWRSGEGLGKHREGTVEPIIIDFKTDRKGLVAEGEKTQKSGNIVVMKDLLGKHPVSALMEMCNKKKWPQPEFVMVHHSGPDHRKNFLFKVMVNGCDYQPQTASPNKKHAKAMAATVALQAMGEVAGDGVHTGPVFTAATST
ncbi:LOW QUALITY PROTEIN: protein SON [Carassius auratus]|uniref:LOW QUALITY PROTEIN: protein SON n=1 Tax=Carassius auratus TaxID=7957 RepID=A0A6P6JL67_CARAU|nr:LOW QUALITY PROTEIN: protein SON-like [Carassius auratus]